MRLSKYTVFYDNYPGDGDCLALNTRTQSVAVINRQFREVLERLPKNGNLTEQDYEYLNQLQELGILVGDEVDETRLLRHWFNQIKYRTATITAMILTTYDCNFACGYCFEEAVKCHKPMDTATTLKTIAWLKQEVLHKRPKSLRLVFYGGEPFLNPAPILEISDDLNKWCKDRQVRFSFGIITNGSLLNTALLNELRTVGLTNIRVTLDGTAEMHDKRRPFRNGHGTFDMIMRNISAAADIVRVDIGGNFDRANLPDLYNLLDLLEAKGLSRKIGTLTFAPVMARMGAGNSTVEYTGCTALSTDLTREAMKLRREVIRRGYRVEKGINIMTCPMTRDGAMVVIDPAGDIYKCAAFVGRPDFVVGNVKDTNLNYRNIEFMLMEPPVDDARCRECKFLPMCGGGCRFSAQLQHQDCAHIACEKEYYEKILPDMLKMEYERGAIK